MSRSEKGEGQREIKSVNQRLFQHLNQAKRLRYYVTFHTKCNVNNVNMKVEDNEQVLPMENNNSDNRQLKELCSFPLSLYY